MDWLRALQSNPYNSSVQDFFWSPVGSAFWWTVTIISMIGAAVLFVYLMHVIDDRRDRGERGIDALMVGRLGWMGALILAAGVRFNSGLQPWALLAFVASGTWMGILIVTDWCNRRGTVWYKLGQIVGEIAVRRRQPDRRVH